MMGHWGANTSQGFGVGGLSNSPVVLIIMNSFKSSRNDHLIEVHLHDEIDVVCPFYPADDNNAMTSHPPEYYVIYRVCIGLYASHYACKSLYVTAPVAFWPVSSKTGCAYAVGRIYSPTAVSRPRRQNF